MVPSIFKTGWHVAVTVLVFCTLLGVQQASAQQTFYSRNATGGGNWDTNNTWSTTGHGGAAPCGGCQQTPGPQDDVIIAATHTVIYRSTNQPAASLRSVLNLTVNGILQFGNNNNNNIAFSVLNDVTVSTGGTIRNGATGTNTHTFNIGGNLENNGTFNFGTLPAATTVSTTVAFTGSGQTITGTGNLIELYRMTNSGGNISTTQPLRIDGTLNFASDGLLLVLAPANITLTNVATITGYNANRYIELDGKATSTSQLIRENAGNVNQWRIFYPVGTPTGGYTPLDLSAAGVVAGGAPTSGSTLSIKPIFNTSIQGQLRRTFRLLVSGNNAATTLNAGARFYYNESEDVSGGDVEANYDTNWFLNAGNGSWTSLAGGAVVAADNYFTGAAGQPFGTGTYYYTIGTANAYPMTWYSYQTGFWKNWENWTQDPSGTTLVNPLNLPPQPGDQVVILNGFTITADTSNLVLGSTTIQGGAVLDMTTMTNNTLGTVSGAGLLRIGSVNLPAGTYTSFVAAGTGGTVEYYNTGGALSTTQTVYNKLWLTNSTNAAITFISGSDLTVNSDFNITQTGGSGTVTWQINNGAATRRNIVLSGNLTVSANGRIRTSTGAPGTAHQMTVTGNIVNNGSIKFFDDTDAQLTDAAYTAGTIYTRNLKTNVVEVTVTGLSDNSFILNGQTDFYRLIINKGTGQQAMLTINSSNVANFRLFGPTNRNYSGAAPNYTSNNALSLVNGTLQLQEAITIPNLVVNGGGGIGGGWPIPQNAALWVNGDDITIQVTNTTDQTDTGRQIYVFGLLRLTKGTMNLGYSRGLLGGGAGVFQMEGGTLNTWQIRTTYLGANNRFAYKQTGGSVNVGTAGQVGPGFHEYPRFALPYQECTFEMSGGNLTVANPTNATGQTLNGGMLIYAAASNIRVTGGNVYAQLPASGVNFTICSTAPFYNLDISKANTTGASGAVLTSLIFDDGTSYTRPAQPLTILNDLTISGGNALLDCNSLDLTVGGNFQIAAGTTYRPDNNTTTFNGTGVQAWTQSGTVANLYRVVMQKAAGTLTLGGTGTFPNITSSLELTAGTLADNAKVLTVTGTLSNSAVHTSTGTGAIVLNNAASNTIGGANGTFGNLTIQTGAVVYTAGKQTVTNTLRLVTVNTTLNIASYNLTVVGTLVANAGFGNNCNIETSGLQNAGGLTRQATSAVDLLFPMGTGSAQYTPVTINATATTAGTITVRPVNGAHPNVTATGQSVQFYWRVTSDGFAGLGAVSHKTYTYGAATRDNAGAGYRAARYDPVAYSWSYSNAAYASNAAPGTTTIALGASPYAFNTGTPGAWVNSAGSMLDGEYTAGNQAAFQTVTVFYSRLNGAWNANTTWSNNADRVAAASGTPCPTCPVVIGSADGSLAHTVTITDAAKSCGSLELNVNAVLDCGTIMGHNFGTNVGGGTVAGRGTLRIAADVFPAGDFINFLGPDGGTVEWYGASKVLPAEGSAPQKLNLLNYCNLIINPGAGSTIALSANDLLVYNTLTKNGPGSFFADNTGSRNLTIHGDFNVNEGSFNLQNNYPANIYLGGITTIGPAGTFGMTSNTSQTHTLTVAGSIVNNGRLQLRSVNHVANITFTGSADAFLTGTGVNGTVLNTVTVDKGTSQTPVLMFDVGGTVQTLVNNWLTLVNGTFDFNNENAYTISTNTSPYNIPATACLKIEKGRVDVIGNVNNNAGDLALAGTLEITGGVVNINPAANNLTRNNDIEYASAGTPTIIVSGGELYVNGAIRRPTTTLSGALVYNQSGGTVTVAGRNAAGVNTRGVFEIENNPGSSFTMTGGTLAISRSTGGTAYADLYINPVTSHVLPNATIEIGTNTTTAVSTTLSLNIVPTIGNLSILGTTTKQFVDIRSSKLNLSGTLQINNNTELETNTLDVTIGGDLSILGTGIYNGTIGGGNTTTFNGSGAQTGDLTTTSTFQNITIDKGAGVATLNGTTSISNLNILRGVLSVSGTLNVNGNIVNNSTQVGNGLIMMSGAATTHTITSGGGSFTNLSLGGTALTKTVDVVGSTTINGTLDFTTSGTYRYLNIASNQLVFGSQNNPVSNAGTNRFIRTNGVSSDLGVVRNWPTGTNTFTYPVGTRTNYTPAAYTLNVSAPGRLTVIAVNEQHPTASANGQYILNYYWMVRRDNALVYGNNGTHTYQFPSGVVGGGSGTFVGAHLDAVNLIGWTRPVGALNAAAADPRILAITNGLTIDASPAVPANMPQPGGEYHYTAGTTQTLPNPVQPVYTRFADFGGANPTTASNQTTGSNWNLATNWTLESTGYGVPLSNVPVGRPVVILPGARMNMNTSGQRAFSTRIDGLLYTGSLGTPTVGHNLGAISGTGTLRTATNTLPAGNYTQFVSAGGGTIEYIAPMTMNNRNTYNNVSVIGSGILTMTNTDLILNGNMTIAAGTTLDNSTNNRDITIAGNWTNNSTFNTGTGAVIFTGNNTQTVNGSTAFYNVNLSKSGGRVVLNGTATTTVNNAFTFTTGYMITSATNPLIFAPAATWTGASEQSFIAGPMRRAVAAGGSFQFPSGGFNTLAPINRYRPARLSNTSAADTWTGQYIAGNPTTDGFNSATFNTVNVGDVSVHEYWIVSRSGSAASDLTLSYDAGSYKPPNIGIVPNLRVVRWTGTRWDFPPGATSFAQGGSNTAGTVTVTTVTNFSPFTLGSIDQFTPLPLLWIDFTAQRAGTGIALDWVTEKERNASHFEVERSEDGRTFAQIGTVQAANSESKNKYDFFDKKANMQTRYYYRIRQVDLDQQSTYSNILPVLEITGEQNAKARWAVTPNPVVDQVTFWHQDGTSNGELQAILTTATGVQLFVGAGTLEKLNERIERVMNTAGAGVYILQLSDGSYQEKFRLVHL